MISGVQSHLLFDCLYGDKLITRSAIAPRMGLISIVSMMLWRCSRTLLRRFLRHSLFPTKVSCQFPDDSDDSAFQSFPSHPSSDPPLSCFFLLTHWHLKMYRVGALIDYATTPSCVAKLWQPWRFLEQMGTAGFSRNIRDFGGMPRLNIDMSRCHSILILAWIPSVSTLSDRRYRTVRIDDNRHDIFVCVVEASSCIPIL